MGEDGRRPPTYRKQGLTIISLSEPVMGERGCPPPPHPMFPSLGSQFPLEPTPENGAPDHVRSKGRIITLGTPMGGRTSPVEK